MYIDISVVLFLVVFLTEGTELENIFSYKWFTYFYISKNINSAEYFNFPNIHVYIFPIYMVMYLFSVIWREKKQIRRSIVHVKSPSPELNLTDQPILKYCYIHRYVVLVW